MNKTGRLRKAWNFFKRGRNEWGFILNLVTTLMLLKILNFNIPMIIMLIPFIGVASIILGWYLIKYVDTTNPYINPYSQDFIESEIYLIKGLIQLSMGNNDTAKSCFQTSKEIRKRWLARD